MNGNGLGVPAPLPAPSSKIADSDDLLVEVGLTTPVPPVSVIDASYARDAVSSSSEVDSSAAENTAKHVACDIQHRKSSFDCEYCKHRG